MSRVCTEYIHYAVILVCIMEQGACGVKLDRIMFVLMTCCNFQVGLLFYESVDIVLMGGGAFCVT